MFLRNFKLTKQQKMLLPKYLRWKYFGWYLAFIFIFDLFLALLVGSANDLANKKLATIKYANIYSYVCVILIVATLIYPVIWKYKKNKFIKENFY